MSTTLTLPDELEETYDALARQSGLPRVDLMRIALEVYAERVAAVLQSEGSRDAIGAESDPPTNGRHRRFASLGAGESPDDGYDSTNYEEWLKKHWTTR